MPTRDVDPRDTELMRLLDARPADRSQFDEVHAPDGQLRPAWQTFAAHAGDVGRDALAHVARRIARQIDENDVTYTVYDAGAGSRRPWTLDALPSLLPADEWDRLEPGLRQYARVMNGIAADVYGPRHLVSEGLLPPALLYPHAGFLRACDAARPPGGVFLHVLALDLARAPDGRWVIVSTRAQAPSGLGYTLENRMIISRLFPDAMRELGVRAITPFCDALQDAFLTGAPCEEGAPQLVLLTPGRFSETYFEHVYLARQLGVPLVEGPDLTVRQDRVFLKTVAGLRRVHAIWRRLDDDFCDPLELRADSTLGVPGLLQAWRAGHVLVGNAFGLSVLESPALLAHLPAIAERLGHGALQAPIVTTHWGGAPGGVGALLDALPTGVIKAARSTARDPIFGHRLDEAERERWHAALTEAPADYVVQDYLPLSCAPVWRDRSLESRALMLRVFLVTDSRGDYTVLPGGLSRIAGIDARVVSGHRGGGSKDTWVLSPGGAGHLSESAGLEQPRQTSGERTTPSRVAEHLFWLGRYAERSENTARLLRAVLSRLTEAGTLPLHLRPALIRTCLDQNLIDRPQADRAGTRLQDGSTAGFQRALITAMFDDRTHHSLGYNIAQLDRVAGSVRDRLASDNWRVLHGLYLRITSRRAEHVDLDDALAFLDESILSLVAVGGLEMAHMTRDDGWRFLSLGRHLERLSFVSTTLDDVLAERATAEHTLLEWLLDLSDSLITYRARHARRPEWPAVVDLLFYDERNPRSAMFQVGKIAKHVRLLPDADLVEIVRDVARVHDAAANREAAQADLFGAAATTSEGLIRDCRHLAAQVSDALTLRYFSHVYDVAHAMVAT